MPKISVIMLVHNREEYVAQAIESVLGQTFKDFEFIIIDNASTDKSMEIVNEYASNDSRIRIFQNVNSNIGSGRNMGLDKVQGEFFTFIDDDDYCTSDYLEFLLNLAQTYCADIAICGSSYNMDGEIRPKYTFEELVLCNREEAITYFLLRKYFNNGNPTKLFRKTSEIEQIRYPEEGNYDDIYTMYKFFVAANTVVAKGEAKYIFRRHHNNNSSATLNHEKITPEWLDEYLKVYKERTDYISQMVPELSELAKWSEWSFMISMVEKIKRLKLSDCYVQLEYMLAELQKNCEKFKQAEWTRNFEREWMERNVE